MAVSAANVVVGQGGSVLWGTTGITQPGSLTAATTNYNDLGYLDEDGVTFSVTPSISDLNVWQSRQPVRREAQQTEISFSGKAAEWNAASVPVLFGGGSIANTGTGTALYALPSDSTSVSEFAVVVDVTDGTTDKFRFVFGRANQTETSEAQFNRSNIATLGFNFSILAPAAGGSPGTIYSNAF